MLVFDYSIFQAAVANDDAVRNANKVCVREFNPRPFITIID
jgi:hypothetical protein